MDNTGARLRALRKEKGLTQQDVADLLGITRQTIANYERNTTQANYEILRQLAHIYGVSIDYLLGVSDERRRPPSVIDTWEDLLVEFMAEGLSPQEIRAAVRAWKAFRSSGP